MQARNFTTNVPKILDLKSSSEQIFFRKLSLGAPVPSTSPRGAYIRRGNLTEGFLRYAFGGLIFGEAYTQYVEGLIFGILRYSW